MSLSISDVLNGRALHDAAISLKNHELALEAHLKSDYEAVKARLEAHVAHYRAEVERLLGIAHADILAHVAEGKSVADAVVLAEQGVKTAAAQAAEAETAAVADAEKPAEG